MEDGSAGQTGDTATLSMTLLHMAAGGWVAQAVYVAAKLGIADLLESGPKSSAELATKTGSHPESLYRLMRMLASLGVFAAAVLIERAGLTDRCRVVSGDFFEGLPANGSLYLKRALI